MSSRSDTFATGLVLLLASAHFIHDVFTAFLAPLLPLIIEKLDLSLFRASTLAVLTQVPSFFNPFLGSFVDRSQLHRLFVVIAPGGTGTLMCLLGIAPSYGALAVILLTAGLSVSSLHVSAPVLIHQVAGSSVGRGMSFFMVAGELARTVGPLVAVQVVSWFGLGGLWRMIPVALASSLLLWWKLRQVEVERPEKPPLHLLGVWSSMRRLWVGVTGILVARAFMAGALTTFLPTFLYGEGHSLWRANISLSILELAGAAGALSSGTLSDYVGRRRVLAMAMAASPPLLLVFLQSEGLAQLVVLALVGITMLSTAPVIMAVVLENAGDNPAAANGTYFMISFAIRALILLVIGALGDSVGLRTAYYWCAGFALFGVPFVLLLPKSRSRR